MLSTAPRGAGSRVGGRSAPGGSACGLSCHGVAGPGQRPGELSPTPPLGGRAAGMLSAPSCLSTTACMCTLADGDGGCELQDLLLFCTRCTEVRASVKL